MIRTPIRALLAGLMLASTGLAAHACGPYTAALYPYARFYYEDPQTGPAGIDKDMFEELARRSGCELRLVVESRVRIWDQMRRGVVQLTLSALVSPERREIAELVPYAQGRYQVLMRRELAARVPSIAAFEADPRLRLLDVRGYVHGPTIDAWVARMRSQGRLVETGDFATAARMLKAGRADALLALPSGWGIAMAAFDDPDELVAVDVTPHERNAVALAMRRSMPEADRLRLRRALQSMLADGNVHEILKRHLGEKGARAAAYTGD
jgi:polar amino acid transport system substrate-binding protein